MELELVNTLAPSFRRASFVNRRDSNAKPERQSQDITTVPSELQEENIDRAHFDRKNVSFAQTAAVNEIDSLPQTPNEQDVESSRPASPIDFSEAEIVHSWNKYVEFLP
jgi:hypothetical protein